MTLISPLGGLVRPPPPLRCASRGASTGPAAFACVWPASLRLRCYPIRFPKTTQAPPRSPPADRDCAFSNTATLTPPEEEIMKTVNVRTAALRILATAVGALGLAAPSHAQITLTYSSRVSPTHHLTIWQTNWAAEVQKDTGGRVKFQSLPKAPAAPPGTFDAVRDGFVDLSYVTASYTPSRHILPLMAELPGAGETAEINSVAYSRIHWKHFHKVGEYKGVKLLAVW